MMRCAALALLLCCACAAWCSAEDSPGTSETCVATPHWKRLMTIFHELTTELTTCRASLEQLNSASQTVSGDLTTLNGELTEISQDSATAESSLTKASASLPEVDPGAAHDFSWWPAAVIAAALCLGGVLLDGPLSAGGAVTGAGCAAGAGLVVGAVAW